MMLLGAIPCDSVGDGNLFVCLFGDFLRGRGDGQEQAFSSTVYLPGEMGTCADP